MGDLIDCRASSGNDRRQASFTGMTQTNHGAPQVSPLILIVEDESFLREVTAGYLEDCGFAVLQAESADDAIGMLREQDHISAVFSDIQMPGSMNGVGLAHWISDSLPEVKVLLTSGRIMPATAQEWTFLPKPYTMVELERRLRAMVVPV
jgi:CheY-like chemotaxis protein